MARTAPLQIEANKCFVINQITGFGEPNEPN